MKNSNKLKRINLQTAIKFLPNSLTLIRLLIVFPIIYFLETNKFAFILPLLILGGLTDYFDGYFAKRYNLMTSFGAVIDPVADKIFTIIPLLWLSTQNIIPYWSISIIIFREFIVSAFRSTRKDGLPASRQAKFKTLFIFISLILFFLPLKNEIITNAGLITYWIGFILTLTTSINYLRLK